ncbi:MAG: glycosyltransferase family 2 protein [Pyrinomonadaceae bacterium]
MPRASVIITTHNRPHLLPRAIESARAAGEEIEIVVVDDASSDQTAEICKSIQGINYVRVERNQGVAGARNIGLVASSGEFVTFLDDDDLRLPGSIDKQIRILEQNADAALVYAQAIPEGPDGKQRNPYPTEFPQGDVLWDLLIRNFIPSGSVVFRRDCLSQIGLLDDSIPGIDDWDLWIRIAEVFPVVALDSPVMIWRQSTATSAQGSSNTVELIDLGRRRFRKQWLRLPRVASAPAEKRKNAWREFSKNIAEHLAWESFSAFRKAHVSRALRITWILIQLHPAALFHLLRRWTRASTLVTLSTAVVQRDGLPQARARFREIRSNQTRR